MVSTQIYGIHTTIASFLVNRLRCHCQEFPCHWTTSWKLCMREDGRQQVCIVGLQEYEVSDVQMVKDFIDKGRVWEDNNSQSREHQERKSIGRHQSIYKFF